MIKLSLLLLFYLLLSIILTESILYFNQILSNKWLKFSISMTYNDLFIICCICILLSIIPIICFYIWLILIIIKYILYFHQIFINKYLNYILLITYNKLFIIFYSWFYL